MSSLQQRRILVTGGTGFVGSTLCRLLTERGCSQVTAAGRADADLTRQAEAERFLAQTRPEVVIHLAAAGRGIADHLAGPARDARDNLAMGLNALEAARTAGAKAFVFIGSADAYPAGLDMPLREQDLWRGLPDASHAAYGLAKRTMQALLEAYRQQYGLVSCYVILTNVYGPGADFSPERSHVIPALIRRVVEAKERAAGEVVCWGSGQATRDFLYVDDAAAGIARAAESVASASDDSASVRETLAVNLGSGEEISIGNLAKTFAELVGFSGKLRCDADRPEGVRRRVLDISLARRLLGVAPSRPLRQGLRRTIDWYRS